MAVTQLPVFREYETLTHLLVDTEIREITSRILDVPTTRVHKPSPQKESGWLLRNRQPQGAKKNQARSVYTHT